MAARLTSLAAASTWLAGEDPCDYAAQLLVDVEDVARNLAVLRRVAEVAQRSSGDVAEVAAAEAEAAVERVRRAVIGAAVGNVAVVARALLACDAVTPGMLKTLYALGAALTATGDPWLAQLGEGLMRMGIQNVAEVDVRQVKRVLMWLLFRSVLA